eukprot:2736833-Pyramimonas_sp.AAC.1
MTAPASGESSQAPTSDEGGRAAVMATAPASGASHQQPTADQQKAEDTVIEAAEELQAVEQPQITEPEA